MSGEAGAENVQGLGEVETSGLLVARSAAGRPMGEFPCARAARHGRRRGAQRTFLTIALPVGYGSVSPAGTAGTPSATGLLGMSGCPSKQPVQLLIELVDSRNAVVLSPRVA
jgi:hypothetical protein